MKKIVALLCICVVMVACQVIVPPESSSVVQENEIESLAPTGIVPEVNCVEKFDLPYQYEIAAIQNYHMPSEVLQANYDKKNFFDIKTHIIIIRARDSIGAVLSNYEIVAFDKTSGSAQVLFSCSNAPHYLYFNDNSSLILGYMDDVYVDSYAQDPLVYFMLDFVEGKLHPIPTVILPRDEIISNQLSVWYQKKRYLVCTYAFADSEPNRLDIYEELLDGTYQPLIAEIKSSWLYDYQFAGGQLFYKSQDNEYVRVVNLNTGENAALVNPVNSSHWTVNSYGMVYKMSDDQDDPRFQYTNFESIGALELDMAHSVLICEDGIYVSELNEGFYFVDFSGGVEMLNTEGKDAGNATDICIIDDKIYYELITRDYEQMIFNYSYYVMDLSGKNNEQILSNTP